MILGIGTDIIKIKVIRNISSNPDDPFIKKTYTSKEQEEASRRPEPVWYFATRFAGKEAVFKCLGIDGNNIRLNDIEIINLLTGQPVVALSGTVREIAEKKGIKRIHLSLSYEEDYAVAFAVAES